MPAKPIEELQPTIDELKTQAIKTLDEYPQLDYSDVGNGDFLIVNPQQSSFYYTLATGRWRVKGGKNNTRYHSKSLTQFLEKYVLAR